MIAQALSMIFLIDPRAAKPSTYDLPHGSTQETVRESLSRIRDELLWPRILVRHAPPPDEVQPNAPDRF
jgi:hypothetical protein